MKNLILFCLLVLFPMQHGTGEILMRFGQLQPGGVVGDTAFNGLVAHWKLNEASGTRNDSKGVNHLTDNNTVTSLAGKLGDAADFENLNSEHLSLADNTDLSTGDIDFTAAVWINLESLPANGSTHYIINKHGSSGNFEWGLWHENISTVNRIGLNVSPDGAATAGVRASTFGTPTTGTWIFVVTWHDATANTINIQVNNGAVDSAAHTTGVRDGNGTFALGAFSPAPSNFFDGLIDSASFWKRVLTANEVTYLYNSGSGRDFP